MIDVYLSLPSSVVAATGIVAENQVSRLYDLLFIHLHFICTSILVNLLI